MNDLSVSNVPGVGKVKTKMFRNMGIFSVEQLAEATNDQLFSVPQGLTLRNRARNMQTPREPESHEKEIVPLNVDKEKKLIQYCLKSHNWWERKIVLPDIDNCMGIRDAIVYELSIEPLNRICFICAWMDQSNLKTMTYSAQFLLFYNPNLPLFHIRIDRNSLNELPNRFVLLNTIEELSFMHKTLNLNSQ